MAGTMTDREPYILTDYVQKVHTPYRLNIFSYVS